MTLCIHNQGENTLLDLGTNVNSMFINQEG